MFRGSAFIRWRQALPDPGADVPSPETDHVLVLIQLSGGNDGLNTVIPIEYFPEYVQRKVQYYIPQDKALKLTALPRSR